MGSVRGRIGAAWSHALLYATGGVAFMGAQSSILPGSGNSPESVRGTITGWTVGAGVEIGFAPNFTGRLEYRYADFGTQEFRFPVGNYTERHSNIQIQTFLVGLTYRFGDFGKGPVGKGPVVAGY